MKRQRPGPGENPGDRRERELEGHVEQHLGIEQAEQEARSGQRRPAIAPAGAEHCAPRDDCHDEGTQGRGSRPRKDRVHGRRKKGETRGGACGNEACGDRCAVHEECRDESGAPPCHDRNVQAGHGEHVRRAGARPCLPQVVGQAVSIPGDHGPQDWCGAFPGSPVDRVPGSPPRSGKQCLRRTQVSCVLDGTVGREPGNPVDAFSPQVTRPLVAAGIAGASRLARL